MPRRCAVLSIALVFVSTAFASADDPDPKEILRKVDAATRAVQAVSYDASVKMTGVTLPAHSGKLVAQQSDKPDFPRLRATGKFGTVEFEVVSDGKQVLSLNAARKTGVRGGLPGAQAMLSQALGLWMQEYLHPTPFSDELASEAKYEGTKAIGGVECDVIYVDYAQATAKARWWFGREDHLPRQVERIFRDGAATRTLTLTQLETKPKIDPATFSTQAPDGVQVKPYEPPVRRPRPARPALLEVGSAAPDWKLKTPAGESVSLQGLRGKVVLMDFWATWCGPCKRAMPGMQKLHEKFADKPVAILGINCWERGDAPAYMKKQELTYGLLLGGDDVAKTYKVTGIPTFYVIGPDGKIVHRASGFRADLEAQLEKIIADALPKIAVEKVPAKKVRRRVRI